MLYQYEIPIAYSMVELAQQSAKLDSPQPFQEFLCYWAAFNNIYSTVAQQKGLIPHLNIQEDGTIRKRKNGSVLIPEVKGMPKERDEINSLYIEFNEALKRKLIACANTRFFVERYPLWQNREIKADVDGQRLNGVISVKQTLNDKHPVWSPIDIGAYERFLHDQATLDDVDLLARQLLFMIYTIRNNTFHGGKRADDANDRQVIEKALPLLRIIVESFMQQAG